MTLDFLQHNLMWVGLALFSGGMVIMSYIRTGGPSVTPVEATLLINRENAAVLDVREQNEFAAGHIAHAKLIPVGQLEKRLGELESLKEQTLIVNCHAGNRSATACQLLRKNGFQKVFNLAGGIAAWEQANLPITRK